MTGAGWMNASRACSSEIKVIACQDAGCERLMSVPGIARSSPARWWPRSVLEMASPKAATSLHAGARP